MKVLNLVRACSVIKRQFKMPHIDSVKTRMHNWTKVKGHQHKHPVTSVAHILIRYENVLQYYEISNKVLCKF